MYYQTLFMKGIKIPSAAYTRLAENLEFLVENHILALRRYIEHHPESMVDALLKLNDEDAKSGDVVSPLTPPQERPAMYATVKLHTGNRTHY
jgi:hypothetical protein